MHLKTRCANGCCEHDGVLRQEASKVVRDRGDQFLKVAFISRACRAKVFLRSVKRHRGW